MSTANGFIIALSEVIEKIKNGAKIVYSYMKPIINVLREAKDILVYVFSVDHIITAVLIVIFLSVLRKEGKNNQAISLK